MRPCAVCALVWPPRVLEEAGEAVDQGAGPSSAVSLLLNPPAGRLVQSFDDDLVASLPLEVPSGGPCVLVVGCRHSDSFLQVGTLPQ